MSVTVVRAEDLRAGDIFDVELFTDYTGTGATRVYSHTVESVDISGRRAWVNVLGGDIPSVIPFDRSELVTVTNR